MVENREDIETQNLEEFRNLIAEKKYTALREKAKDMNDSDLAYIMDNMEDEDMLTMFRLFPKELAADVFSQLTLESQQYIITSLSEKEAGSIIKNGDSILIKASHAMNFDRIVTMLSEQ